MEELIKQLSDYLENNDSLPAFLNNGNTYRYWIYDNAHRKDFGKITKISEAQKLPSVFQQKSITVRVCYGAFLSRYAITFKNSKGNAVFVSYINREVEDNLNFTWLTKKQLFEHIEYCRQRFSLDFDFTVKKYSKSYIVVFDFKKLTHFQVKFILFWTRYAWEFPSNLALFDAMLLHKALPNEEMLNLLALASGSLSESNIFLGQGEFPIYSGQCICNRVSKFINVDNIVEELKSTSQGNVTEMFPRLFGRLPQLSPKIKMRDTGTRVTNLKEWVKPENIDRRMHLYIDELLPLVTK